MRGREERERKRGVSSSLGFQLHLKKVYLHTKKKKKTIRYFIL